MAAIPVLKHKRATLERIEKFISDKYFVDVNLYGRINKRLPNSSLGLELLKSTLEDQSYSNLPNIIGASDAFSPLMDRDAIFQPLWSQHWVKVVVKAKYATKPNMYLYWDVDGAESLVCDGYGMPVQGLSCKRKEFRLTVDKNSTKDLVLFIQVSCTGLFGAGNNGMINPPNKGKSYALKEAYLFERDGDKYQTYMDLSVMYDIAKNAMPESSLSYDAMFAGNAIINIITLGNHSNDSYKSAQKSAQDFFDCATPNSSRDKIHAIGNCHIDCAWLWPYKETVRKVARSWSSTLSMMHGGYRFKFAGSQVVQFDWLQDHYPKLFSELQTQVRNGNFVPVGGSWVEMDTNIPNGESLIRQFIYGQMFYQNNFSLHSDILWLPDTFGYSGQLPQIMKLCDVNYFLSQKLSWNLTNTFPHHSFYWKGIDGSKVLAHFPPGDTYESEVNTKDILKTISNNKDKGRAHDQMLLFGHGDGGGGPTPDMIERLERFSAVLGFPEITHSTPSEFFEALEKSSHMLCEWWGELYFELHRGTYTSHAKLKEYNRKFEFMMMDIEFLFVSFCGVGRQLPKKFEQLWKIILFNQFHDILPGSSIEEVFKDAMADYSEFSTLYTKEINELTSLKNIKNITINPYHWPRREIVKLRNGQEELINIPGLYAGPALKDATNDYVKITETKECIFMNNKFIQATFSRNGHLKSLIHKNSNRECLNGTGNVFVIFDDIPLFWDAWDVMEYHVETRQEFLPCTIMVLERGPLTASVEITVPLADHGHINVIAMIQSECPYLAFKAQVDWKASHKFLKVEFPLSVTAQEATYEIQCGLVRRPTHNNTSWDTAKFEVSGHKWAHIGEPNFGVGILSKSKYGYSSKPNQLTLSLLRSSKAPDANADIGEHVIEYAIYPHSGPLCESRIVQHALHLNHPLLLHNESSEELIAYSPATVVQLMKENPIEIEGEEVIVQCIKQSEDGKGLVIRCYEPFGNTCSTFIIHGNVTAAYSVNAVERFTSKEALSVSGNKIGPIDFSPFQIRTVYIEE